MPDAVPVTQPTVSEGINCLNYSACDNYQYHIASEGHEGTLACSLLGGIIIQVMYNVMQKTTVPKTDPPMFPLLNRVQYLRTFIYSTEKFLVSNFMQSPDLFHSSLYPQYYPSFQYPGQLWGFCSKYAWCCVDEYMTTVSENSIR